MSRINIFGLKKERKKILEELQRMGVVDVRAFRYPESGFEAVDTGAARLQFQKAKHDCENALDILESYAPEEKPLLGFLQGKGVLSRNDYEALVNKRDEILDLVTKIIRTERAIAEQRACIAKLIGSIDALKPWLKLSIPLSFRGTDKTTAFVGTLPTSLTEDELLKQFDEICEKCETEGFSDKLYLENINMSNARVYALVICHKSKTSETEEILKQMGFAAPVCICDGIPAEEAEKFRWEIKAAEKMIEDCKKILRDSAPKRDRIKFLADYYTMRISKYEVLQQLGQSRSVFAMCGYVPTDIVPQLVKKISEGYVAAIEASSADEDEAPVSLKNNGFAAPLEGVLETFSLPNKGEVDPTFAMSLFYYFLFGVMLSDAGYGILMVLFCGIALLKLKRLQPEMRKTLKMYFYCGISTTFWGIMFGSFFGDAVQVISTTFFGKTVEIKPLWFTPINEPMRMLMFSLLIGIIHLFAGLFIKLYSLVKAGNLKAAICDVVFWYLLVGGAIVYLLSMQMFVDMANLTFILPPTVGKAAVLAMLSGAVGIALTGGRTSKNPFKRLAKGLYELYNVTGYLSDILSYSRLLALGLATGVIANVFNKMGSMFGGGVLGAIAFSVVFVIGHTLNMGINLLGAYVHTNRLQFVEFFGKFYVGGGTKYTPFKADTGYYDIKND